MAATTVADIMERDAPSIPLDAGVEDVVAQFKEQDVAALPVVNEGGRGHSRLPVVEHGRYVGLVTRADVLAALNTPAEG
jgi:CBS domain-containing protein